MFMLFGYNYYEILAYIDVSGDKAVEEAVSYTHLTLPTIYSV